MNGAGSAIPGRVVLEKADLPLSLKTEAGTAILADLMLRGWAILTYTRTTVDREAWYLDRLIIRNASFVRYPTVWTAVRAHDLSAPEVIEIELLAELQERAIRGY